MNIFSLNSYYRDIKSVSSSNHTNKILNFNDYKYKIEQNAINNLMTSKNIKPKNEFDYCLKKSISENDNTTNANSIKKPSSISDEDLGYNDLLNKSKYRNSIISYTDTENSALNNNLTLKSKEIDFESSVSFSHVEIDSFEAAEKAIAKAKQEIIDYSSQAVLIQASYLISASAVLPIFYHNRRTEDDSDD